MRGGNGGGKGLIARNKISCHGKMQCGMPVGN
jgi:hypothetical protein